MITELGYVSVNMADYRYNGETLEAVSWQTLVSRSIRIIEVCTRKLRLGLKLRGIACVRNVSMEQPRRKYGKIHCGQGDFGMKHPRIGQPRCGIGQNYAQNARNRHFQGQHVVPRVLDLHSQKFLILFSELLRCSADRYGQTPTLSPILPI